MKYLWLRYVRSFMVVDLFVQAVETGNILLFLLLALVLFIAFRILQMFVQTVFVAFLSGAFYIVLANTGTALNVNVFHTVFFAFLGAALFIVYSLALPFVNTAWQALKKVVDGISGLLQRDSSIDDTTTSADKESKRNVILQEVRSEEE